MGSLVAVVGLGVLRPIFQCTQVTVAVKGGLIVRPVARLPGGLRKGGKKGSLAIHPHTAQRIRDYVAKAGNEGDNGAPLFLPVRGNQRSTDERRHLHPDEINRIIRKYARDIGLERGYSAHSMRATFITTALENGAGLEDVQLAAGHADPSTTKLYDRRG